MYLTLKGGKERGIIFAAKYEIEVEVEVRWHNRVRWGGGLGLGLDPGHPTYGVR